MRLLKLAVALLALTASGISAQGWIDPIRPSPQWGVVKVRTAVTVRVTDRIARVEVEEYFQNRGQAMGESDYLYPLPGEAVFSNFSLYQGDQELKGETMDARQARAIYEEIVRSKRDPALIELAGHGLVRARVFPIAAGETRRITLRYTQVLARAGDALQFRYAAASATGGMEMNKPMLHATDMVPPPRGVRGRPAQIQSAVPLTLNLIIDAGSAFRNAFSPTHEIRNERRAGKLLVSLNDQLTHDLALFLPMSEAAVGLTVAAHKPSSERGYFMLTLSPGQVREAALPRDITAVIDVSGSMSGEKMRQARNALTQLVGTLTARDRFRLIAFSSDVRSYRAGWTEATDGERRAARGWIDQLQADGGTNIAGALDEAFALQPGEERLGLVIFLTDGLPSVGEQNPERIAQRAERSRGNSRVFVFGVGYDVNTYLLDRLSAAARGSTQYVQPGENVEQAMGSLAARVQHPVLTDLRLGAAPVRISDVYPRELPDLFAGEELIVFGRYETERDALGTLNVVGKRSRKQERFDTQARFPAHENSNDFIPKLWAARKVGALTQEVKLNGQNPELVQEIRELALRYGLLSEYTSYLVLEPGMTVNALAPASVGRAMGAAAPPSGSSMSGAAAVQASERTRKAREAKSQTQMAREEFALQDAAVEKRADLRIVGGRQFRLANGVWTDAAHAQQRIVPVEAFSAAYFALLRELPELETILKSFDQVSIAGKRVTIKIGPVGGKALSGAELSRIVTEFRVN